MSSDGLTPAQRNGLQRLALAVGDFEPLAALARIGPEIAEQLVALGLAERGPCAQRMLSRGYSEGYRLSQEGWQVLDRKR